MIMEKVVVFNSYGPIGAKPQRQPDENLCG